ncbi:hypothetical protein EUTSA_v10022383mg, partial [Eutrema salsugineum]
LLTTSFAGPIPNPESDSKKLIRTQVSSRERKVSSPSILTGFVDRPPSCYSIKIESFHTLVESPFVDRYESDCFEACDQILTLIVYPEENKDDNGTGYISLYVSLDTSNDYFDQSCGNIFAFPRFNADNTIWGLPRVLPLATFNNEENGYLYDDQCEFGVDIFAKFPYAPQETFSITNSFPRPTYTWYIPGFSTLPNNNQSEEFRFEGTYSWTLQIFLNGDGAKKGKNLSVYLNRVLTEEAKYDIYDKVYARAKLRVLNNRQSHNFVEKSNSSKGFVVDDVLIVQVEIEAVSILSWGTLKP